MISTAASGDQRPAGRRWAPFQFLGAVGITLLVSCSTPSYSQIAVEGSNEPLGSVSDEASREESAAPSDASGTPGISDEAAPVHFLKAAEAYETGRYQEAASTYRMLIAAGFDSGDLRYDLANALLRSGELGRAIAEYRRAQVLSPRDQDIRANLAFARKSTKDAVLPPQPTAWTKSLFFWHYALNETETFKLLVGVAAAFWGFVAILIVRPNWRSRWPIAILFLGILALAGSLAVRWRFPQSVAVVLPAQTNAYSGTDLQSRIILNLHAGTELEVTNTDEQWTQFRMPDNRRGWLPTEDLEIVDSSTH